MGKWLVGAGIAILVMLVLLWRTLDDSSATAAPPAKPVTVAVAEPTTPAPSAAPVEAKPVVEAAAAAPAPEPVKKIDVESDEFFYKFQEVVPAVLSRNAVKCYEGVTKKVHRNQNAVYKFKVKIKDGVVTIKDAAVERSNLGDGNAALETCFLQEIARSTWSDPELPDWEADDQLTISPERGLKKYTRENIEYVGEPAPRE